MRRAGCMAAVMAMLVLGAASARASAADPYCAGSYGGAAPRTGQGLRFGIDPGIAGSAGT